MTSSAPDSPHSFRSRHSLAAALWLRLALTLAVFLVGLGVCLSMGLARLEEQHDRAQSYAVLKNLQDLLPSLMVSGDDKHLTSTLNHYERFPFIAAIKVSESDGDILSLLQKPASPPIIYRLQRPLYAGTRYLGELELAIAASPPSGLAALALPLLWCLLLAVFIGVMATAHRMLQSQLSRPLARLLGKLAALRHDQAYSSSTTPTPWRQELATLAALTDELGYTLEERSKQLLTGQSERSFVQSAILSLFTAKDRRQLLECSLSLLQQVSGGDLIFFQSYEDLLAASLRSELGLPSLQITGANFVDVSNRQIESQVAAERPGAWQAYPLTIAGHVQHGCFHLHTSQALPASSSTLVASLVAVTGQALLRRQAIAEQAVAQARLDLANAVQRSMLPDTELRLQRADVSWFYQAAEVVSGDWFHVMESQSGRYLYILMGDVTGHGIASGLVTTAVAGAMTSLAKVLPLTADDAPYAPSSIISQLDELIRKVAGGSELRMTCVAVRCDFEAHELSICNAGHTFPLLLQTAQSSAPSEPIRIKPLTKNQGPMLGEKLAEAFPYASTTYSWSVGERLLLYTDGLTEASDKLGKAFYRSFIRTLQKGERPLSLQGLQQLILTKLAHHCQGAPLADDVCLVMVAHKRSSSPKG